MALSWPLPLESFFEGLPIQKISCRLGRAETSSETGGGEVISHGMGTRLWRGRIVLDKEIHTYWAAIEAKLALLEQPGASLLLRETRVNGTRFDPQLTDGRRDSEGLKLAQNLDHLEKLFPNGFGALASDVRSW